MLALASDQGTSLDESHSGELLDERAEQAYRARLERLGTELAGAERLGQPARVERLSRERDMLDTELRRAVGLAGRVRQAGSATQRARVSVQKRLKEAIGRVGAVHPSLGRFLEQSVTTGTFCCFRPRS